jgi:hypothetical protein
LRLISLYSRKNNTILWVILLSNWIYLLTIIWWSFVKSKDRM